MKKAKALILSILLAGLLLACSNSEGGTKGHAGANRLEDIIEKGYIEVATEPYFAPNEFIDPSKEGQDMYVGADMEMAQYIADDLGVDLKIVPLEFGAVLSGVSDGKYDLAISALAYTPAREEAMILSDGYYYSDESTGYGILTRESLTDEIKDASGLTGRTVVVQSGSLQEAILNDQVDNPGEVKKVSATTDGFLMVEENKAEAMIVSNAMAQLYIEANPDAGLKIVEDFRFEEKEEWAGLRVGIPKGEEELAERINKIIAELNESGQYYEWYDYYTDYAKSLGLE